MFSINAPWALSFVRERVKLPFVEWFQRRALAIRNGLFCLAAAVVVLPNAHAGTWQPLSTKSGPAMTWHQLCPAAGSAMTWRKIGPCTAAGVSLTISSNVANYNLKTAALAAGWNGTSATNITVTVNSGVIVYSNSTSTPAFDTGTGFPAGTTLTLVNNGYIVGKGGAGGIGHRIDQTWNHFLGAAGEPGGPAVIARFALSLTNMGTIGGGGGGGGGGGTQLEAEFWVVALSGSGGGGAGYGAGGVTTGLWESLAWPYFTTSTGGTGGLLTGGAGGPGSYVTTNLSAYGAAGGAGGGLGSAGATGGSIAEQYYAPTPGGSGGPAVTGNSFITWTATGTRYGAIQ